MRTGIANLPLHSGCVPRWRFKNMKIEISAGGVVFKLKNKKPLILLIKDHNDKWTFPKGLIENNEDKIATAKREIAEEVDVKKISLITSLSSVKYWYKWQGELVKKTVYYYLFETKGQEKLVPQEEEGISEAKWFTPEKALKIASYRKTGGALLKEAIEKIKQVNQ